MDTNTVKSRNFVKAEAGDFEKFLQPEGNNKHSKKFFRDLLGLTGMEMSITAYPPNAASPFFHSHKQNEELYIFLKGEGQMQLDDELVNVREGSVVRVLPQCARSIKNGPTSNLVYLCLQAKDNSLEQCTKEDGILEERKILWQS